MPRKFLFLLAGLACLSGIVTGIVVHAQTAPTRINNWLWSSTIGWVKTCDTNLACTKDNPGAPINPTTGAVGGYGWSSNIGWINFNPGGTPPVAPFQTVKYNSTTKGLDGWARACSVFATTTACGGPLRSDIERGGWDGWIRMHNVAYNQTEQKFAGFAWGHLVNSWLNFWGEIIDTGTFSCIASPGEVDVDDETMTYTASPTAGGLSYRWYASTTDSINSSVLTQTVGSNKVGSTAGNTLAVTYGSVGDKHTMVEKLDTSGNVLARAMCSGSAVDPGDPPRTRPTCTVMLASIPHNGSATWSVRGSLAGTWTGYKNCTDADGDGIPTCSVSDTDSRLHNKTGISFPITYNQPGDSGTLFAAKVTVNGRTSDFCKAKTGATYSGNRYLSVENGSCKITVYYKNYDSSQDKVSTSTSPAYPFVGGVERTAPCGPLTLRSFSGSLATTTAWVDLGSGATACGDTSGAPTSQQHPVTLVSGTPAKVCVDFQRPAGGDLVEIDGDGTIDWDNPGNYPAPVVTLLNKDYIMLRPKAGSTATTFTISSVDWSAFDRQIDGQGVSCSRPSLMIGNGNTIVAGGRTAANPLGSAYPLSSSILIYYPSKCVNTATQQSALYRFSKYSIVLNMSNGQQIPFLVKFNDYSRSND